jgi:bifunctional DNase/RNase
MSLIPVEIVALSTYPTSGQGYALVLEETDGSRRLPIVIGGYEAQAIALELEKIKPPRPLTHDLIKTCLDKLGAEVDAIVVDELREGTFFAKIRYTQAGVEDELDARPSDAIAIGVRLGAPIFVDESVMEQAGVTPEDDSLAGVGSGMASDDEDDAEPDEPVAPMTRVEKIETQLETAIAEEDYERAAQLRDELARLQGNQSN